jgi:hypothetical protein
MKELAAFRYLDIDWDLSPEDAVTMYLEWGNNDWRGRHPPVRSGADASHYFVLDSWGEKPLVRLVRRTAGGADDLVSLELPKDLETAWLQEYGRLRGIFEPTAAIKEWLLRELDCPDGAPVTADG